MPRYQLQSWLNFIGTEVHKNFGPLFNSAMPEEAKQIFTTNLLGRLKWVDGDLAGKSFLMGNDFTVADAHLFVVTNWAQPLGIDLSPFKNLLAFREGPRARPCKRR